MLLPRPKHQTVAQAAAASIRFAAAAATAEAREEADKLAATYALYANKCEAV